MDKHVLGIDVGGTTVKCGLFDTSGELLKKWEIPTDISDGGKNILPDIAASAKAELADTSLLAGNTSLLAGNTSLLAGVGIGVPGPVLRESYVPRCVNLGWGSVDVAATLSDLMDGVPVKAANDANLAALGEMWKGGGRGFRSMMLITLGTGVGGGIVLDGKILPGLHGTGGEIGHITVNPSETLQCTCGRYGCLEQYASATGLVRTAKRMLAGQHEPTVLSSCNEISAKRIVDAARDKDPVAEKALDEMCDYLAMALGTMASTLDPEAFVIGGGVSRAGQILIDGIKKHFPKYHFVGEGLPEFYLAQLGNDAGIYGAAKLIFG